MDAQQYAQLESLADILTRREELDPELVPYVEAPDEERLGWAMLRHPLVYVVPYSEQMNAMANAQFKAKTEALREVRRKRNWHQYVYLFERPYRINAFANICYLMGDAKYWELLGDIWQDSENIHQNMDLWVQCLTAPRRYRSHLMSAGEREALAHDIDKTDGVIYRGFCHDGAEAGLSWTTNSVVAKFFARRFAVRGEVPRVASGRVDRRDIIAFFDGRSEYEVLVLPHNVRDIEIVEVPGG